MKYKDYLNSARKHEATCGVIYEKIMDRTCPDPLRRCLLLNLYYLTGYIIECSIKYGIFDLIGYDRDKDVKLLNRGSLTYDRYIKHHRFSIYAEQLVVRLSHRLPLVSDTSNIDNSVVDLYNKWGSDVRYSYDLGGRTQAQYIRFYEYGKQILRIIRDNVRG